ncbi:MAG: DUF1893 domain-containing protein [Defluviitaleaceae bacterium]|nr:DUF1893 domain-containing protein [Defluviitaleaceae bacterium]
MTPKELPQAIDYIKSGEHTCIVMQDGVITHKTSGIGVKPIKELYENQPEALKNAQVADKVIGKAAAMLLHLAGAAFIYGNIMSARAVDYLEKHNIPHQYGMLVDAIINRAGDDTCPLEKAVLNIEDKDEAYEAIKATIAALMAKAASQ